MTETFIPDPQSLAQYSDSISTSDATETYAKNIGKNDDDDGSSEVAVEALNHYDNFVVDHSKEKSDENNNKDAFEVKDVDIRNYLQYRAATVMGVPLRDLDDHSMPLVKVVTNESMCSAFTKKIKDILPTGVDISTSFINDHSNINSITKFVMDVANGNRQPKINDHEMQKQQNQLAIEDIVDRSTLYIREGYTQSAPTSQRLINSSCRKVFLLTGTTGFLGAHILHTLLSKTSSQIYCLLRKKKNRTPRSSLKRVFLRNGFDTSLVDSDRLIAFSANLSEPFLGLNENEYEMLLEKVTTIIHGASSAKLGSPLSVYENSLVRGTANLLLFGARKEFHFVSSIDACVNGPWERVPEGILPLKASITNMDGFGLSKLAIETIIANTLDHLQLERASIIRTGQITSHTETGVWNPNEWIPLLLGNVGLTGRMPILEANLDWVPVDIAAKAIVELVTSDALFRVEVFHISNPNPTITWEQYLDKLEECGMKFTREELPRWLENLCKDAENNSCDKNLCSLLTEHFNSMVMHDPENGQKSKAILDLSNTRSRTSMLSKCPSLLTEDLIKRNVDWLKDTGYLSETIPDQQISLNLKSNRLRKRLKNGEQGIWGWISVTVPLMVFFFIIDILWSVLSQNLLQVTFIAGFFVAAVYSDDTARNRNQRIDKKKVMVKRRIRRDFGEEEN
ncbi:14345_t:CDS:2 [Acaulospora morrowiae]|uniref:14345_t:CDS:1 n=1 Tax=Acaulospora morrowiae TaxID=94023 RepID=A0A9N9BNG7_9GLOM|nr:14345_t:CDS:2 [Acaulospora morrowiae]